MALVALAVGLTLTRSPVLVARTNSSAPSSVIAETTSNARACQGGEVLPARVSAIRLTLFSGIGPRVGVRVLSGGRVITSGVADSGWTGGSVTVPVRPLNRSASDVQICFGLGPTKEKVSLVGSPTPATVAATSDSGEHLPGRIRIEYLRSGQSSWWSLAQTVARHMGVGRSPAGTWVALLVAVLMAVCIGVAAGMTVRELS